MNKSIIIKDDNLKGVIKTPNGANTHNPNSGVGSVMKD